MSMRAIAGSGDRGPLVSSLIVLGSVGLLALAVVADSGVKVVAPLVLLLVVLAAGYRSLLRWHALVACVIGVIFFIPIKRYSLGASLPFNLEPYRILIGVVAVAWFTSLLIDPRVHIRGSGLEKPIVLYIFAALASVALNDSQIHANGVTTVVVKTLTFFASFFILFYIIVSVVRTRERLDFLIRVLVGSGAIVAFSALVESRTNFNVFNHLSRVLPMLHFYDPKLTAGLDASYLGRGSRLRAYASAAHPIELSATLAMLIPLAIYLLKTTKKKRWLLALALLSLGVFATLSRTGIIMMLVIALVFLWLRPVHTRRLWPLLLPALVVIHFALPQTLGSFYAAFFPKGGLVAQQDTHAANANQTNANGRLARIGPGVAEWSHKPVFGEGFGSRLTSRNGIALPGAKLSQILDDQWLGSLLETGAVGVGALLWLFIRSIRRMRRIAREDDEDDGWLAVAFAASIYAFAVGMLTFDALGFIQVTILLFITLAFSSVLANLRAAGRTAT
jgi:hypothetical protein